MRESSHLDSQGVTVVDIADADVRSAALELLKLLDGLDASEQDQVISPDAASEPARISRTGGSTEDSVTATHEGTTDPVAFRVRTGRASVNPFDADGYRGAIAARVAGITYRQLDYWARTELLEPSVVSPTGDKLYGITDILWLKLVKRLLDTGISLQQIRAAIESIRGFDSASLRDVTLLSDGESVWLARSNDEVIDLVSRGQGIFGIAVGKVQREVLEDMRELPPQLDLARRKRLA
jgi:DNA-binding transcriptional MerR regulator